MRKNLCLKRKIWEDICWQVYIGMCCVCVCWLNDYKFKGTTEKKRARWWGGWRAKGKNNECHWPFASMIEWWNSWDAQNQIVISTFAHNLNSTMCVVRRFVIVYKCSYARDINNILTCKLLWKFIYSKIFSKNYSLLH